MRLKLDENLSAYLKAPLEALGHDVSTAADEDLLSQPDEVVARHAFAESRMLLTLDVELGSIIRFPPGTHPGIIVFRLTDPGPLAVNRFVEDFVRRADLDALSGCIVSVEAHRTRVRWPEKTN